MDERRRRLLEANRLANEKAREIIKAVNESVRNRANGLMAALPVEVTEDALTKYRREANELEASRERERQAMQREHRAEQT